VKKKLTSPLTLTLSRKGRGEIKRVKRIPLKTSSPLTGEDRGGGEKKLTSPLTLTLSRKGRGELERIRGGK
jgi:hypothetical protein